PLRECFDLIAHFYRRRRRIQTTQRSIGPKAIIAAQTGRNAAMSIKSILSVLLVLVLGAAGYAFIVSVWSYSSGERAGWVQKFSKKGWLCKTWEGEMAMVSMPGSTSEKFFFTVWDDDVAEQINKVMGKRVAMHYEEKVGIPTSCFGETSYYVTSVKVVEEIPLAPGVVVPTRPDAAPAPAAPAPAPATPEKK